MQVLSFRKCWIMEAANGAFNRICPSNYLISMEIHDFLSKIAQDARNRKNERTQVWDKSHGIVAYCDMILQRYSSIYLFISHF